MNAPCKDCPNRRPPTETDRGCHTDCEAYADFCKERELVLSRKRPGSEAEDFLVAQYYKYQKNSKKRKGVQKSKR